MLRALRARWQYARYRHAQIRQSRAKRHKDASFRLVPFVAVIRETCPDLTRAARVLCIGARNEVELDVFQRHGFPDVSAVDLWSSSPRIRVMDMHALRFADASFDLVFASHVFEHAWDLARVAAECVRVLKPGGYLFCAVPIGFAPTDHDRYDLKDAAGLLGYFTPWRVTLLHERVVPGELSLLLRVEG
jgi:SAM-dependent methyltransferase